MLGQAHVDALNFMFQRAKGSRSLTLKWVWFKVLGPGNRRFWVLCLSLSRRGTRRWSRCAFVACMLSPGLDLSQDGLSQKNAPKPGTKVNILSLITDLKFGAFEKKSSRILGCHARRCSWLCLHLCWFRSPIFVAPLRSNIFMGELSIFAASVPQETWNPPTKCDISWSNHPTVDASLPMLDS